MNFTSTVLVLLVAMTTLFSCTDETSPSEPVQDTQDAVSPELVEDIEPACDPIPTTLEELMTPTQIQIPEVSGVDKNEGGLASIEEAASESDDVFFWATFDHDEGVFRLKRYVNGALRELVFKRSLQASHRAKFDIVTGQLSDFFAHIDPLHLADLSDLYEAYENPTGVTYTDHGYADGEPRMGFLDTETTSYPLALERIAALFNSPNSPDVIVEYKPNAKSGPGTHGCLDVLQSRATLVLAGAGLRKGLVLDDVATLTDVAPTVMAALGAPTTQGRSLLGEFQDGLYLKRQDGRVLNEVFAADSCERAKYAVIILMDGLMASEINHQLLSNEADVDLPHMRSIAQEGVVYRGGAVSPWPSFSAPGHMTVGTGVWSGHHGIVSNSLHDREAMTNVSFFGFISKPEMLIQDSSAFLKVYERFVNPEVETLAQAAHRAFGDWDPESGQGAFVAVLNDLPILGADRTSFDLIAPTSPTFAHNLDLTNLADDFALNQALELLEDSSLPTPKVLQLSFYTTDKAGEEAGPHSNLLRESLPAMDGRIGELMAAYKSRGSFEDTVWVLVSDHGMALQDTSKTRNFATKLAESGVKFQNITGMIYLKTLALNITMAGLQATVVVNDHGNNQPVSGATVKCSGCTPKTASSDDSGTLVFQVPAGALVEFEASHPSYNPQEQTVGTPLTE